MPETPDPVTIIMECIGRARAYMAMQVRPGSNPMEKARWLMDEANCRMLGGPMYGMPTMSELMARAVPRAWGQMNRKRRELGLSEMKAPETPEELAAAQPALLRCQEELKAAPAPAPPPAQPPALREQIGINVLASLLVTAVVGIPSWLAMRFFRLAPGNDYLVASVVALLAAALYLARHHICRAWTYVRRHFPKN